MRKSLTESNGNCYSFALCISRSHCVFLFVSFYDFINSKRLNSVDRMPIIHSAATYWDYFKDLRLRKSHATMEIKNGKGNEKNEIKVESNRIQVSAASRSLRSVRTWQLYGGRRRLQQNDWSNGQHKIYKRQYSIINYYVQIQCFEHNCGDCTEQRQYPHIAFTAIHGIRHFGTFASRVSLSTE